MDHQSSPSSVRLVSRRAVATVGLTAAATLAAGCTTQTDEDRPAPEDVVRDPDRDLLDRTLRDEQALVDRMLRARRRHGVLRVPLVEALSVHRAHVTLLRRASDAADGGATPGATRWKVPATPAATLAELRSGERALHDRHVATAMAAASGTFARLVASLAAAAAQQERALSQAPVAAGPPDGTS
jgi:hypothetical protein